MNVFGIVRIENNTALLPVADPFWIKCGGWDLPPGDYLVSGVILAIECHLMLLLESARIFDGSPKVLVCAVKADDSGSIPGTGLSCEFSGSFVGNLAAIIDSKAVFTAVKSTEAARASTGSSVSQSVQETSLRQKAVLAPENVKASTDGTSTQRIERSTAEAVKGCSVSWIETQVSFSESELPMFTILSERIPERFPNVTEPISGLVPVSERDKRSHTPTLSISSPPSMVEDSGRPSSASVPNILQPAVRTELSEELSFSVQMYATIESDDVETF